MGNEMTRLSDYLAGFEHTSAVTPMTLEIDGTTYESCSYSARFETLENSPAYLRGERHYWQSFIYCIGELPTCYRRNTHVAFVLSDTAEWYIACYWPRLLHNKQHLTEIRSVYPRFGPHFLLAPWDAKEPIDKYERTPYRRVRVQLTNPQTLK